MKSFIITPIKIIRIIFRYEYRYVLWMIPQIIINSILPLLYVYAPKLIIEKMTDGSERTATVYFIISYICALLCLNVFNEIVSRKTHIYADSFAKKLRLDIGETVMSLSIMDIERSSCKDIAYMAKNAEGLTLSLSLFQQIISNVITIIGASVIVASLDAVFFVTVCVVLAFKMLFTYIRYRHMSRVRITDAKNSRAIDYLQGLSYFDQGAEKEIRVNNLQNWFIDKMKHYRGNMVKMQYKDFKLYSGFEIVLSLLTAVQSFVVLFVLVGKYSRGQITVANFTLYFSTIVLLTSSLSLLSTQIGNYSRQMLSVRDLERLKSVNLEGFSNNSTDKNIKTYNFTNVEIEFKNVSFVYDGAKKKVLDKINLKISDKEKLAIVGYNGSGKSTLIKLLCKFYKPTEGKITVNGIDIWSIPNEKYYSLISAVFQDYGNFAFSIRDNIVLKNEYMEDKLNSIIDYIGLKNKINSLPDGTDTFLSKAFSQNGVELSGGEGQKVAIARALYKDSSIMILDEPTAELDVKTESEIYEDFLTVSGNKTAIFISHRLAVSRLVDKIVVLDKGKIIEYGSHTELIEQNGIYRKMYDLQSKPYILRDIQ